MTSGQFVGVRTVKLVVSSACSSYCAFSSTESYIHSVGEIFLSDYQEVMIAHGKLQDLSASHYVKLGLGNYVGWCTLGNTFLFFGSQNFWSINSSAHICFILSIVFSKNWDPKIWYGHKSMPKVHRYLPM